MHRLPGYLRPVLYGHYALVHAKRAARARAETGGGLGGEELSVDQVVSAHARLERELRGPSAACLDERGGVPEHVLYPARDIAGRERIDVPRSVVADLRKRRAARDHHGAVAGHRLDGRKPEAFPQAREDRCGRGLVEPDQLVVAHEPAARDALRKGAAAMARPGQDEPELGPSGPHGRTRRRGARGSCEARNSPGRAGTARVPPRPGGTAPDRRRV